MSRRLLFWPIVFRALALAIGCLLLSCSFYAWLTRDIKKNLAFRNGLAVTYTVWPRFQTKPKYSSEWYRRTCFTGNLTDVVEIFNSQIPHWSTSEVDGCKSTYEQFDLLYEIHKRFSRPINIPKTFEKRVRDWLNNDHDLVNGLQRQQLIYVYHPLTSEQVFFNPLRASRPIKKPNLNLHEWVDRQVAEAAKNCDFCAFFNSTATDELGRNVQKHTVRVSNPFKIERWHSLVIARTRHHPLKFTLPEFVAFHNDTWVMAQQIQSIENDYMYSSQVWETLYQGGSTILHPHIHVMVANDHYYGFIEHLRTSGQRYFDAVGRNYFNTLVEIHEALGLTVHYGDSVALSAFVGKADMEVMFLSEYPSEDFFKLIYYTVMAYHDTFSQLCKGFSSSYPAIGVSREANLAKIPAIGKLISRGECTAVTVDYTSSEIFQMTYRRHDPWQVARAIRKAIKEYDVPK